MRMNTRVLLGIVALVGILGSVLTFLAFPNVSTKLPDLWLEVGKTGLGIVSIAVVGGLVSWVFRRIDSDREEARRLNDYRQEILRDFLASYRGIKNVRRHLRVAGLTDKYQAPPTTLTKEQMSIYTAQMELLNEAQLELERIKLEVESSGGVLSGSQPIRAALKDCEHYVGDLVTEWEKVGPTLLDGEKPLPFSSLEKARDFTGRASDTMFRPHVSNQVGIVVESILVDLLPARWAASAQPVATNETPPKR
jgi:hypothetical protein